MADTEDENNRKGSSPEAESQFAQALSLRAVFSCTLFMLFMNWPLITLVFEAHPRYAYFILFCYWFLSIILTLLVVRFQIYRKGSPPENGAKAP